MQWKMTTDYALSALIYLTAKGDMANAAEIAEEMDIPQNFLYTVMGKMRKAGIVSVERGVTGGWRLAVDPKDVQVRDVLDLFGDDILYERSLEDEKARDSLEKYAPVCYRKISEYNRNLRSYLHDLSLSDLCAR